MRSQFTPHTGKTKMNTHYYFGYFVQRGITLSCLDQSTELTDTKMFFAHLHFMQTMYDNFIPIASEICKNFAAQTCNIVHQQTL